MPGNLQQFGETQPLAVSTQFQNGDGTSAKSICPAQTGPYRVDQILLTNTDSSAHNVDVYVHSGALSLLIGSVGVPIGTGLGGVPAQEAFAQWAISGFTGITLPGADQLYMSMEGAVGIGNFVNVQVLGGIF